MFCSKCGAENPEGAKFCSKCGAGLGVATTPTEGTAKPEAESSTGLTANVAGLLCYVAGWITGIIVWVITVGLWIALMLLAYQGKMWKVPLAGDWAEKQANK